MWHLILEGSFFMHSICWNRHCYWWNNRWSNHSYGDHHCFMYQTKVGTSLIILYVFLFCILCCVFVLFDLALGTLCCQLLSFIHSSLSLRFRLTEIYFVLYLLFKKTSFKQIFCNKRFYVWVTISQGWPTNVNGSLYERWPMSLFRVSHSSFISV